MDNELDKWICEKLQVPYKPFTWEEVVFFSIVTHHFATPTTLKLWPKKYKIRAVTAIRAIVNTGFPLGKYHVKVEGKYRMWNGHLSFSNAGSAKWFPARTVAEMYYDIIFNINKYKLTYSQLRELHFGQGTGPVDLSRDGYTIESPEVV